MRGGHRFLRPSFCAKFVLKDAVRDKDLFKSEKKGYTYHGTKFEYLESIFENGLRPGGFALSDTKSVKKGADAYGAGVYTTKFPQYAEHYTDSIIVGDYYLRPILLCR